MEHNGRGFVLARLDRASFNHKDQTGFALEGKHREQKCEACHNENRIPVAARAEIRVKDLNRSFLGLRRECLGCHEDRHRGQLGDDCARCHSQLAWKPVTGFDHSHTNFPLTGLHQAVACLKCHAPRTGEEAPRFKGLVFSACQSCHIDPHRGAFQNARFRGSCDSCHNTSGWKNSRPSANFRHETTRFPLVGKHNEVPCSKCHKTSDFAKPVAHERCHDCHEDPHRGQFAARAGGSDCSACHSETGFKPSRFDREMHNRSAFRLEGKHASLACVECHKPEGRSAVYITGKLVCSACHEDRHAGEFAGPPYGNRCERCHTTAGFQPATFSTVRHEATRFALTGRHASVECHDCHKPLTPPADRSLTLAASNGATAAPAIKNIAGAVPRKYHFATLNCATCHADPHQTKVLCETCHTTEQWKAVQPFDHSTTKFRIEGSHLKVKCIQCHIATKTAPEFSNTASRCSGCHRAADVHGGQFQAAGRDEDCASCHVAAAWKSTAFSHDTAQFPLDVAHRNVACGKCHKDRKEEVGKVIRTYRGTPKECVQCH